MARQQTFWQATTPAAFLFSAIAIDARNGVLGIEHHDPHGENS
jgi:hypothetical protein